MRSWFVEAFGEDYLRVYLHRDAEEAERALAHVFDEGELLGATVLDVACGAGRYLEPIESRGAVAVGVDLSRALLDAARSAMPAARLCQGDMRRLPFATRGFDWALSMFTSFGYFEDETAHGALAVEFGRVVRRGLILDVPDPESVADSLVEASEREAGGLKLLERRWLSIAPRRVNKEVRVFDESGRLRRSYEESVMLFTRDELESMFATAGLALVRCMGDYDGSDHAPGRSPRQVLRFERRKETE